MEAKKEEKAYPLEGGQIFAIVEKEIIRFAAATKFGIGGLVDTVYPGFNMC
jgi:hypothetical protein